MEKMKFEFTKEEVEQILNGMAQLPYIQVFELIANIHNQSIHQFQAGNSASEGFTVK